MSELSMLTKVVAGFVLSGWIIALADPVKMPMRFTPEASAKDILNSYPLGTMNELAVLSHHGKADKVIELPNGRQGWIYDMGIHRVPKIYTTPTGKKQVVKEREKAGIKQVYTLVFSKDGYVIDVLFRNKSSDESALQVQYHKMNK